MGRAKILDTEKVAEAAACLYIGIKDSLEYLNNAEACWRCKSRGFCPCPVDYSTTEGIKN